MTLKRPPYWLSLLWSEPFQKLIGDLLCQLETAISPFVHIYVEKRATDMKAGLAFDVMKEVTLAVMWAEA